MTPIEILQTYLAEEIWKPCDCCGRYYGLLEYALKMRVSRDEVRRELWRLIENGQLKMDLTAKPFYWFTEDQ